MEAKGTLKDVSMDWKTGRMRLTFELETDISSSIDKLKDKPLRIAREAVAGEAEPGCECILLGAFIASGRGGGHIKPRAHNLAASEIRSESHDCRSDGVFGCTGHDRSGRDGAGGGNLPHPVQLRRLSRARMGKHTVHYTVLAGSSTYDTKEMSELINGLVAECKEQELKPCRRRSWLG
ncbi:MAG: hypothetical protein ACLR8P_01760 [Clostridium fessum]